MKRLLPLLGIAALISALAACGGGKKRRRPTRRECPSDAHTGTLIVGFDLPAPAFWNGQANGTTLTNPVGFRYASRSTSRSSSGSASPRDAPAGAVRDDPPRTVRSRTTSRWRRRRSPRSAPEGGRLLEPYFNANQGVLIAKGVTSRPRSPTSRACRRARRRTRPASTGSSTRCARQNSRSSTRHRRVPHSTRSRPARARRSSSTSRSSRRNRRRTGRRVRRRRRADRHKEGYGAVFAKNSPLIPYRQQGDHDAEANGTIGKLTNRMVRLRPDDIPVLSNATRRKRYRGGSLSGPVPAHVLQPTRLPPGRAEVWEGFKVNLKIMFVAEALVLVLALLVAIVRGLPGRAARRCAARQSSTPTSSAGHPSSSFSSWCRASRRSTISACRRDRSSRTPSSR